MYLSNTITASVAAIIAAKIIIPNIFAIFFVDMLLLLLSIKQKICSLTLFETSRRCSSIAPLEEIKGKPRTVSLCRFKGGGF